MDEQFGDYLNHDFAQYHVAACADVLGLDASGSTTQTRT